MSQALEQFQSTLVYRHSATTGTLLQELAQIRSFDKEHESQAKKFGCIGALLIPAAIAGGVLGSMLHPAGGGGWAVVAVAAAIFLFVKAYGAHKNDVEDRRYQLASSIIDLLSKDVGVDTAVTINMSLRKADRKENYVDKGTAGRWKFKMYHDPWLQIEVKLLDGTTCRIQVIERHQKRHRWKTSASGKRKYKTKVKSAMEAVVRLKPKRPSTQTSRNWPRTRAAPSSCLRGRCSKELLSKREGWR